ncbi:MAG: hypothetical protein CFE45_43250 [Burkholderiales bacterium PBB5]|nr:MAG: hypothetical protein CFE45_43250 [Burkholderiales bacterium PBB5]
MPLAAGRVERAVMVALHGLAWAVAGHWLAPQFDASGAAGLWVGALFGLALGFPIAGQLLPIQAAARLRWTGADWQLDAADRPVQVDVQIDAGVWLLLRWRRDADAIAPDGPAEALPAASGWLVAWRGVAPQAWHGLRVALQAHAGQRPAAAAQEAR